MLAALVLCGACGSESEEAQWGEGGVLAENFLHYDRDDMAPARVCESLAAMDSESLATKGRRPAAIFDLDNTLWSGEAIDPFFAALIELEMIPARSNPVLKGVLRRLQGVD